MPTQKDSLVFNGGICRMEAWKPGVLGLIRARMPFMSLRDAKVMARLQGACVHSQEVHNLVVTIGKQFVGDMLIAADTLGLTYFAFGTGVNVPAIGDTALQTEQKRGTFTSRVRSGLICTLDAFFTAANSTYFIKECGIFGGISATVTPGSGTLFCHYALSYDNSAGANDLTFEYQLTIG
jgi:hypothetical protein